MIHLSSSGATATVAKRMIVHHHPPPPEVVPKKFIHGILPNFNPATGEVLSPAISMTTPTELSAILSKANFAQKYSWGNLPLTKRVALLREGMTTWGVPPLPMQLANTITNEMGKIISESQMEVQQAIDLKGEWLDMIQKANEDVVLRMEGNDNKQKQEGDGEGVLLGTVTENVIVRDPLGVVAVLSPWNFPALEITYLAIPALVAGNAVIVKPSEHTPLTGAMVCHALASALPEGVLQVVQGDGTIGKLLVSSEDVHMVAMTGSNATGKDIMKSCAKSLKRLVLELGGKDPMIVFADADLDLAAKDAVKNSLANAGQVCCSIERIYVEKSVQVDFEKRVVDMAQKHRVGMPMAEGVTVGPLVSRMQWEHVRRQVQISIEEGATILYESDIPDDVVATTTMSHGKEVMRGGNFHPITVLGNVQQTMSIQKEETFGPIIAISTFDGSEEDAITLANDTEYGLAACVYTTDLEKASRVARRIRAGQVGVNCYSADEANLVCPWVGHKQSGFGMHSGMDGFRSFSVPKSLVFPG